MKMFILAASVWALFLPSLSAEWQTLRGCQLLPNASNDGDSFHVEHDGTEYIFRLYFVDCPETDLSFPERVAEQGGHFGVSSEQAITLGKKAAAATASVLARRFTVVTRFQDARGRSALPRHFAFVKTSDGKDLAALLAGNGFARAFGVRADAPDGQSASEMLAHYAALEQRAKKKKLGAYGGKSSGRMAESMSEPPTPREARVVTEPVGLDSPELLMAPDPFEHLAGSNFSIESVLKFLPNVKFKEGDYSEIPGWKPSKKKAETPELPSGLISLNSATNEELQTLPKIGTKRAQAIIARRPFSSVEDLRTVPYIGPKIYAELIPLVSP